VCSFLRRFRQRRGHISSPECTLLAPIAGALILLFGLHLLGILIKLTVRTGSSLARWSPFWVSSQSSAADRSSPIRSVHFFLPLHDRFLRAGDDPLAEPRTFACTPAARNLVSGADSWLVSLSHSAGRRARPILATVLALAAASDTIARGVLTSCGVLCGLAVLFFLPPSHRTVPAFLSALRKHLHAVELFSGALLLFLSAGWFLRIA